MRQDLTSETLSTKNLLLINILLMCFCFNSVIHKGVPLIRQSTLKDPVPSDRSLCIVLCPMHLDRIDNFPFVNSIQQQRERGKAMSEEVQQYCSFYRRDQMCSLCKQAVSPNTKQKLIRKNKAFSPNENKILGRKHQAFTAWQGCVKDCGVDLCSPQIHMLPS